jgi:ATP-dependent DNA helicase RecG
MLNDAVVAIAKNLRRTSVVKGLERFDELEIPESVFREALANALVHREYNFNFQGQAIAVDVFPNRIEITSPGMLWGGKSIDNLDNGESCCRNAALMKLLMFAPLSEQGGFTVEGNGSGIIHMIRTMKSMNLPAPEFEANFSSVKVTLWRGASQQSDDEPRGVAASKTAEGNSANSAQSRLEKESMEILNLIKEKGEVGMSDLKVWGGYTDSKARTRVNHLLEEGLIEPTAEKTSRNRKYRIKRSA